MKRVVMRTMILTAMAAAVPMISATPATAQRYNNSWNSTVWWQGAPSDVWQRISFVQTRIDRGVRDGSLNRREYRRVQNELNRIRRDAQRMRGRNNVWRARADADRIQVRLDRLSQRIRWERADGWRGGRYSNADWSRYRTDYDATRYYRDGPTYRERQLTYQDEIYRGSDGRYYCKRDDGTTGLIVGGVGGAVLGNVIDGGDNRLAGTLIGGALGALVGREVDRSNSDYRCR